MHVAHNSSENIILKLERVYRLIDEWKLTSHNIDATERYRIQNLIDIKKREIEKNVSAFKKSCASNFDDIRMLIDRQLREIMSYLEPARKRRLSV
ncbi:hypothetical protein AB9P05_15080 [Roseivirga sp. BDSF3-8]|uniref:hypothetical protein n=1 Tax=Roseivirga sp. BDSF3-8 TaxID=3241598 RepID=UPI0035318C98